MTGPSSLEKSQCVGYAPCTVCVIILSVVTFVGMIVARRSYNAIAIARGHHN